MEKTLSLISKSEPRAGIADVASRAGVSQATVSRVLNGDPRVGDSYRQRVEKAVKELDYRPNRIARSLRTQRSQVIGVVVSDIENPHFSEMVRAVEDSAYGAGYPVIVCNTDESPAKQRDYLRILISEQVLGVIISPSDPQGPEIAELLDDDIPVVAFDREVADPRADAVVADNIAAAREATELTIEAGHRDIVFVGGRTTVETGSERQLGYELAMQAADLTPRSIDGAFRLETAGEAVNDLLRSGRDVPSALVIANNLMTLGALGAIQDVGVSAHRPTIVALDDPPWAPFINPPLTTLAQPVRRMAEDAMELLLQRVSRERTAPRRITHRFELRLRGTLRPD